MTPQLPQPAHPAMNQRIADAIERRATTGSFITVNDRPIRHKPFSDYRDLQVVGSDDFTITIADKRWPLCEIESYDPATGDFVVSGRTVAVRALPRAA